MAFVKFETNLKNLLKEYVNDATDLGFNGQSSINGAPLKTRNPKTIENFLKWLEKRENGN